MRRTERPAVDSGTQAGIHVPVSDLVSIVTVHGFTSSLLDYRPRCEGEVEEGSVGK